jgi:hypothetical protein
MDESSRWKENYVHLSGSGKDQAQMTATVDGENTNRLEKGGLKLPLSHEDIEKQFPQVVFQKKTK